MTNDKREVEPDQERVNRLEEEIFMMIVNFYKDEPKSAPITQQQFNEEALLALHYSVAMHIMNIDCPHCRRQLAEFSKQELPHLIDKVLVEAAEHDKDRPISGGSAHSH